MSEPHLSAEDLNAFAMRRVDASRVQKIFAHLSSCAMCRERSQEALDTDRSVERLVDEVVEQRPAPSYWIRVLAACLAIAVIGVLLFLMLNRTTPVPPASTTTAVVETSTQPATTATVTVPSVHPAIAEAFARGRLVPPTALAALLATPSSESIRGGETATDAVFEPNREVVPMQRPHFRFPTTRGAPSIVRVFDRDHEVLHSEPLDSGEWTATSNLPRGVTYTWQVETTRDGETAIAPAPPTPPARFIVLDADAHRALENARREQPRNDLLLGILSARAGLREDAQTHLRNAAKSGDPRVTTLLRSVQNWPR